MMTRSMTRMSTVVLQSLCVLVLLTNVLCEDALSATIATKVTMETTATQAKDESTAVGSSQPPAVTMAATKVTMTTAAATVTTTTSIETTAKTTVVDETEIPEDTTMIKTVQNLTTLDDRIVSTLQTTAADVNMLSTESQQSVDVSKSQTDLLSLGVTTSKELTGELTSNSMVTGAGIGESIISNVTESSVTTVQTVMHQEVSTQSNQESTTHLDTVEETWSNFTQSDTDNVTVSVVIETVQPASPSISASEETFNVTEQPALLDQANGTQELSTDMMIITEYVTSSASDKDDSVTMVTEEVTQDNYTETLTNATSGYENQTIGIFDGKELLTERPSEKVQPTTEKPFITVILTEGQVTTGKPSEKPREDVEDITKIIDKESMNVTTQASITTTWSPQLYVTFVLSTTWQKFCEEPNHVEFQLTVFKVMESLMPESQTAGEIFLTAVDVLVSEKQIVIWRSPCKENDPDHLDDDPEVKGQDVDKTVMDKSRGRRESEASIPVRVVLEDFKGYYSYELTKHLAGLVSDNAWRDLFKETPLSNVLVDVKVHGSKYQGVTDTSTDSATWQPSAGILVGIVIGILAAIILVAFLILQLVIMRKRRCVKKMRHSYENRYSIDTLQGIGMENIQLTGMRRTANHLGYANPALVIDDKDFSSNPLNFTELCDIVKSPSVIEEEYLMLPNYISRVTDIPLGAEDKNRYANVIPVPESRVPLSPGSCRDDCLDYINANFIRGYLRAPKSYIATQAPLDSTREDFWHMVYQYKAQAILMLTALTEHGSPRCTEYWPNTDGGDTSRQYGEYNVALIRREIRREWITSVLRLKKLGSSQYLDVHHFWLTSWPPQGLPDSRTLLGFLLSARPYMEQSIGPTVVHCSPGTGRTGVVIAIDSQMSAYDDTKIVDILSCVVGLRQDRAGLVQNKDQYRLIYKAVFEYAQALHSTSRNESRASSISSLHVVQTT